MSDQLVPINTGNVVDISQLYGVGEKLAVRVVAHRQANGYFRGPEDLARVDGISQHLAETLATSIDWAIPVITPERKQRDSGFAFLMFAVAAVLSYRTRGVDLRLGDPLITWINYSVVCGNGAVVLSVIITGLISFTTYTRRARVLSRLRILSSALALLALVSLGIGNFIYYQIEAGWQALLSNTAALSGLFWALLVALIAVPLVLTWWRPSLISRAWFTYPLDGLLTLFAVGYAWFTWNSQDSVGILLRVGALFTGFSLTWAGLAALRTGESVLRGLVEALLPERSESETDQTKQWITWINVHLPDPDRQRALRRALDEMHPSPRIQRYTGAIILGAGSWLLLTVISAIIQAVVQKRIDPLLK